MLWKKGWQFLSIFAFSNKVLIVLVLGNVSKIIIFTVCNVSMFMQKGRQFLSILASSNKELNVPVQDKVSHIFSSNEVLPYI